jgi:hypothetical protein
MDEIRELIKKMRIAPCNDSCNAADTMEKLLAVYEASQNALKWAPRNFIKGKASIGMEHLTELEKSVFAVQITPDILRAFYIPMAVLPQGVMTTFPNRTGADMNDQELADKIVVLGVGSVNEPHENSYWLPDSIMTVTADRFCDSWLVAGAMIEKCKEQIWIWKDPDIGDWLTIVGPEINTTYPWGRDNLLPRAINKACVQALQEIGE